MSGIFPNSTDGGIAPNPDDPSHPNHAYDPVTDPVSTAALYYGNGCDVRLRPEVVNSLISEIEATCDAADYPYNAGALVNLQTAARYLIQRGKPRGVLMIPGGVGTENHYSATLDPPATGYNNFMTVSFVPTATNTGPVWVNCNGRGEVPIVRSSGLPSDDGDFPANTPFEAIYYNGKFYVVGAGAWNYGIMAQWFQGSGLTFTPPSGVITGWTGWDAGRGNAAVIAGMNYSNTLYTVPPRLGGLWLFAGYCNTLTGPLTGQTSVPGYGFRLYKGPIAGGNIISAVNSPPNVIVHGSVAAYCDMRGGDTMQLASLANEAGLIFRNYSFTAVRVGQSASV